MGNLVQTVAPVNEIITTAEAKEYADIETSDDDDLIDMLIEAVTDRLQELTWRQFITATYTLTLHDFPDSGKPIIIPMPGLQSVSSITYNDENGDAQTFATSKYSVDTKSDPGMIHLTEGSYYPITENDINSVTITFVCGYGDDASDVPNNIKLAARMLVRHFYFNREALNCPGLSADVAFSVNSLIRSYKVDYHPEEILK